MKWTVLSQVLHLSCVPVKDMAIELCACTCQDSGLEPRTVRLASRCSCWRFPAGRQQQPMSKRAWTEQRKRSLARDSGKVGRSRG
jgi:hypothetical protein